MSFAKLEKMEKRTSLSRGQVEVNHNGGHILRVRIGGERDLTETQFHADSAWPPRLLNARDLKYRLLFCCNLLFQISYSLGQQAADKVGAGGLHRTEVGAKSVQLLLNCLFGKVLRKHAFNLIDS